ncbi:DUF3750 domain-containing protein [Beggiatoa alba]|nr:DUF3750 domain-containing protein [Beggiatoa alba]
MSKKILILIGLLFVLPIVVAFTGNLYADSHTRKINHVPINIDDTAIQIYAARTWGLKKFLAVHTWIALKHPGDNKFTRYEIFGWAKYHNKEVLIVHQGDHDAPWYGNEPTLLTDIRGQQAQELIGRVEQAINDYPFRDDYTTWPGPNSNTFTAFIGRQVPELKLDLPSTAIGKDYRELNEIVSRSASGSGIQFSLWGLFGVSVGIEEGLELNLLGLNVEFDFFDLAIELPGIGRIGAPQFKHNASESSYGQT